MDRFNPNSGKTNSRQYSPGVELREMTSSTEQMKFVIDEDASAQDTRWLIDHLVYLVGDQKSVDASPEFVDRFEKELLNKSDEDRNSFRQEVAILLVEKLNLPKDFPLNELMHGMEQNASLESKSATIQHLREIDVAKRMLHASNPINNIALLEQLSYTWGGTASPYTRKSFGDPMDQMKHQLLESAPRADRKQANIRFNNTIRHLLASQLPPDLKASYDSIAATPGLSYEQKKSVILDFLSNQRDNLAIPVPNETVAAAPKNPFMGFAHKLVGKFTSATSTGNATGSSPAQKAVTSKIKDMLELHSGNKKFDRVKFEQLNSYFISKEIPNRSWSERLDDPQDEFGQQVKTACKEAVAQIPEKDKKKYQAGIQKAFQSYSHSAGYGQPEPSGIYFQLIVEFGWTHKT